MSFTTMYTDDAWSSISADGYVAKKREVAEK